MNRRIAACLLFALLLAAGCASTGRTPQPSDGLPEWVNNPARACGQGMLCAVGSGSTLSAASADARAGLAKIFQARVRSSYSLAITQRNAHMAENVRLAMEEQTDQLVRLSQIKLTARDGETFYSLAALDREVNARLVKSQIDVLDARMSALARDDSAASLRRLENMFEQRQMLNAKHTVLTGESIPDVVDFATVYRDKKAGQAGAPILLRSTYNRAASRALNNTIRGVLMQHGYVFAGSADAGFVQVTATLDSTRQPMNIRDLVRYRFIFTLRARDQSTSQWTIVMETSFDETAVDRNQAFSYALGTLREYLEENIDQLTF
ncbi:MAG: LPP20 family lipoprotein [Alphaproteobacteria bacterium]|nr:LPP20 family lipoprotein [Alphaproteobacteria bacterium]